MTISLCLRCEGPLISRTLYAGFHDACAARSGLVLSDAIAPFPAKPRKRKKAAPPDLTKPSRCHFCGRDFGKLKRTRDHLQPRSRGGTGEQRNIVWACSPCNSAKGAMTEAEFAAWIRLVHSNYVLPHETASVDREHLVEVARNAFNDAPSRWDEQQRCSLHTGVEAAVSAVVGALDTAA